MDQDRLRHLVISATPKKLADEMAGLSEKERRNLSTFAQKLRTKILRDELDKEAPVSIVSLFDKIKLKKNSSQLEYDIRFKSQLAIVGLSSLTNAKRIDFWRTHDGNENVLNKVVRDRKPEWLTDLVKHDLEKEFGRFDWSLIYGWVCDGLCEPLDTAGYYEQFSMAFHGWEYNKVDEYVPISQALASQPALLEREVWGLFKHYTLSFQNDWNEDNKNAPENYETWPKALVKLSQQNLLERSRLLDESLAALDREFEPHIKSGFHKFHVLLTPEIDEIVQRKTRYLELLSQPVGHVVNFAIKMLKKLEKKKQLTLAGLLPHVSPVFSLSSKTQAIEILKMIRRLASNEKGYDDKQIEICLSALSHENIDVQEHALSLIETIHARAPQAINNIEHHLDFLHPSLKARLLALSGDQSEYADNAISSEELENSWQDVIDKIKHLTPEQQRQGLSDYLKPSFKTSFPPPLPLKVNTTFFNDNERIEPIQTVEELILAVSHAVEVVDSADEVERILDGISRLCDQYPANFSSRTEALKKRIADPAYSETARGLVGGYDGITRPLNDLLHTWLTGNLYRSAAVNLDVHEFIEKRLQQLSERVADQITAPLLSAPTHQMGWIVPGEFVQRILEWQTKGLALDRYDLIQALLRLSFIGREQALIVAENISDNYHGALIRWALGSNSGPETKDRKDTDLWVTASRCRFVYESAAKELVQLNITENYPDTVNPAIYKWKSYIRTTKGYGDTTYSWAAIKVEVQTEEGETTPYKNDGTGNIFSRIKDKVMDKVNHSLALKDLPSYLLSWFDRKSIYQNINFSSHWLIHWGIMTWPANINGSMSRAACHFVGRVDEKGSSYEPNYAFLEPVFYKDTNWTEMVRLAIWTALVSLDADAKGMAIDLLIQGIDDGRAHPEQLSNTLISLSSGGWVKSNRLSSALTRVAQVSDLHGFVCLKILEPYLYNQDEKTKNLHQTMELMLALYIELGFQPESDLVEKLKAVKGTSKKAKAAKALLSIEANNENNRWQQAILEAVETRLSHVSD